MKKILYIGNNLNNKNSNVSSINILGYLFEKEGYTLYYSSSKVNKIVRLLDMIQSCFINRKVVDFVIIDTYSTWNFYFAIVVSQLCRLLALKYILRLNGGNLEKRLKNSKWLSKIIFNNAYKLVSPSLYLNDLFKTYGYHNVVYIPNSIEIGLYPFKKREIQKIKLLWVRSFSEIYNPRLAVSIYKGLLDENIDAKLCMVGPDSDGSFSNVKLLAKKLSVEVKFTGKLSKIEWKKLSEDYNIFINTTNFDNMPVSVIEAMALGLVIVSTNVGGMPYLIEDKQDGILVGPNNEKVFIEAISELINSPKSYNEMVFNARAKVEQFDWEVIKHLWFKVLQ